LKFGDIVTAVASLAVIMLLITVPIRMVLVPALGFGLGINVSAAVSILLSALIGGYIFAGKIWEESRMAAIAKITVFAAVLMMFFAVNLSALPHWGLAVEEAYKDMYTETATWSTSEWLAAENIAITNMVFFNVVMVLVLGFIGLYVGSMLRRPAKSRK